jgi:adenylate kinase family enzyme
MSKSNIEQKQNFRPQSETDTDQFPDVIVFFGPPASGKGTQARILAEKLPDFIHFDFGSILRTFVSDTLGSYEKLTEIQADIYKKSDDEDIQLALRAHAKMVIGEAIDSDDLWGIIGKEIDKALEKGKKLIIEGIGRTVEDGKRFGKLASINGLVTCIFHVYISPDEAVRRAKTRFYIPNSSSPYPSFGEAKLDCNRNEVPFQRPEDLDSKIVLSRYKKLYTDIFAKVVSTIQIASYGRLFIIDGEDSVEDIAKHTWRYLERFYNTISTYK